MENITRMNKRQKKKFIKKNITKLRKIHLSEGDIVVLQWNPDSEYIDFDTIVEFYKAWENAGIFDKCGAAIIHVILKFSIRKKLRYLLISYRAL